MKMSDLTKQEAEQALKNGYKIYLDDNSKYLKAEGINKEKFYDQTGFNFTEWFYLHAPKKGWNIYVNN